VKNLWIFNHYANEPSGAGGTRHYHLAKNLRSLGWDTVVFAASSELNTSRQRLKFPKTFKLSDIADVKFLWVYTPNYSGNGLMRCFNILSYCTLALLKCVFAPPSKPQLIIGSSVHPFAALLGLLLSRYFTVPFIFEVRDLWPQTLIDLGRIRETSFITFFLKRLELLLYRNSNSIITLLPNAHEYITALGIDRNRIEWIPNGVELAIFPPPVKREPIKSEAFHLMYFGAHGLCNDLENLLQAMKIIQSQEIFSQIRLTLIGDGPLKLSLLAKAEELGLKNVTFKDPMPKSEIHDVAVNTDAFIFNLINVPVFRYGISSNKLFDYMALQKPVIFCCDSSNNPVQDSKSGITVLSGSPKLLSKAIIEMASFPVETRLEMGRMARKYVEENHDFEVLASRLSKILFKVLNRQR
jgi:glycosyltransferase involved in cell wall biosynthesis